MLDFGLAKLREAEGLNEITSSGTLLGTPYYMAPEQVRGEEVDQRSDVYAIGALMYRCLTGHHPFDGEPMTVLSKHLNEIPIPPAERAPHLGIPLAVSRLVMRALSMSPEGRFQRVEDLQSLLVEAIRAAGSSSVVGLLDSYGGPPPQIQESISDRYTLLIKSVAPETESESDAAGHAASATPPSIERHGRQHLAER